MHNSYALWLIFEYIESSGLRYSLFVLTNVRNESTIKAEFIINVCIYTYLPSTKSVRIMLKICRDKTQDQEAESGLRRCIANTFEKTSQEYNPKKKSYAPKNYYGKTAQRIPAWALKPNQYNHQFSVSIL